MKKQLIGVAGAVALALGMAGNAHAFSPGAIATGDGNSGVDNIYSLALPASRAGYYGGQIYLVASGPINLTISFLGREAGYNNTFNWGSVGSSTQLFENCDFGNDQWNNAGFASVLQVAAPGLLPFFFGTPNGNAVNGANPDNALADATVNFFATIYNCGAAPAGTCTSGSAVDLWLDDQNGTDDNHDDMAVRISVEGGSFQVVPIPAAAWLLGSGLLGLFGIARRRSVTAA